MKDVITEIDIDLPVNVVADYSANPDNATRWYQNIKTVRWQTERPLVIGTRIVFVAEFMGKELRYTYEVVEYAPHEKLVMRTADGPFPMETIYRWDSSPSDGTRMTLINRGTPKGFSKVASLLMRFAVAKANRKDLKKLKSVLERLGGKRKS